MRLRPTRRRLAALAALCAATVGGSLLVAQPALAGSTPFGKAPAIILTSGVANDVTLLGGADSLGGSQNQLFVQGNAALDLFGDATTGFAVTVSGGTSSKAFTIQMQPATGQTLGVGSYVAERVPTASRAGFDIFSGATGCTTVFARVNIRDLEVDVNGDISRVWLTYEHHCDGSGRSLIGEVRINEPLADNDVMLANAALDFPESYPGTTTRTAPVWLVNTSTAPVDVTSAAVSGTNAADYTIGTNACTATLDPGQFCSIDVGFSPAVAGPSSASLDLVDTSTLAAHSALLNGSGTPGSTAFYVRGQYGTGSDNGNNQNGHALALDLTPAVSGFAVTGAEAATSSGVDLTFTTATHTLTASFYPATGDQLTPGTTYTGATKSSARGSGVGLYFTADGSTCSLVSGQFSVVDAAFDPSGGLTRFAAYFSQTCGSGAPVYGWVTYHADAAMPPFGGDGPTSLSASSPGSAARGAVIPVHGVLSSMGLGLAGKSLTVKRMTLVGTTSLPPVVTDSLGAYSFTDTPSVGGPVTYSMTWAGDAHNGPSNAATAVSVARLRTTVTIRASVKLVSYGHYVTVTAGLAKGTHSRVVEIWVADMGATPIRYVFYKRVTVSSLGTYAFSYRLYRNRIFQVRFVGDAYNAPATARVNVASTAYMSTVLFGSYRTVSSYHLYASSVQPELHGVVYPRRYGVGCVRFQGQYLLGGAWKSLSTSTCQPVTMGGFAQAFLIAKSGVHPVGVPMRFRSLLAADYINAASVSAWAYLKFTN